MLRYPRALLILVQAAAIAMAEAPTAPSILERVRDRMNAGQKPDPLERYAYTKRVKSSELDEASNPTKTTEKVYHITPVQGRVLQKLVLVDGKPVSGREAEKENHREGESRKPKAPGEPASKSRKRERTITLQMLDRFEYRLRGTETLDGRTVYVLDFSPQPGRPEKTLEDKVYRRIAGTLWVDAEEAEIRRVDAALTEPLPVGWFGAAGSLSKLQVQLDRTRLPDGSWVGKRTVFSVVGRKLFSTVRSRTVEESEDYRPVDSSASSPGATAAITAPGAASGSP